jgi:sterol 24-C-methyltransferase
MRKVESTANPGGWIQDGATGNLDTYRRLRAEARSRARAERHGAYASSVRNFYDLVTDFYEFAWGSSFHFAPRAHGESFAQSIARHERFLADELGLDSESTVLDVGCGVGGPMREIARHSGASIVGLNNNAYQIERGKAAVRRAKLGARCSFLEGDFANIPTADESFDAIYTIESTCHANDRETVFRELCRVLRPGGEFAGYEWCVTDLYDPDDPVQKRVVREIEEGNGLPALTTMREVFESLKNAGFDVIHARDKAPESAPPTPWYHPLSGASLSLSGFPRTWLGRRTTSIATDVLERVGIAPRGTSQVSRFLNRAADALVEAGRAGIFTPMFYFHARKREA